jgi:hypothetical protein
MHRVMRRSTSVDVLLRTVATCPGPILHHFLERFSASGRRATLASMGLTAVRFVLKPIGILKDLTSMFEC